MSRAFNVQFPPGTPLDQVVAVHPTQLYQVLLASIFFIILWRLRDHRHAAGWLFGAFCVLAGIERFIVEFFRAKDDRFYGGLTTAQLLAIAFVVGGGIIMAMRNRATERAPGIYARA